jgi:hypothetical protein
VVAGEEKEGAVVALPSVKATSRAMLEAGMGKETDRAAHTVVEVQEEDHSSSMQVAEDGRTMEMRVHLPRISSNNLHYKAHPRRTYTETRHSRAQL